jgi:eukaryotic-like serine/threonine-protein kinase
VTQRVAPLNERGRPNSRLVSEERGRPSSRSSSERANRGSAFEAAARPPRYEPLFELEQSGCARSHLAIDHGEPAAAASPGAPEPLAGDHLVVVHVVPPTVTRDPAFIPRFTAGATALLGMSHPNLVRTLDFVANEQRCQWTSEFIQGHTLTSLLGKKRGAERALTLRQHLTILCEVLRGLEHAHRLVDAEGAPRPIVHHHLSPSSVLVSYEGEVKVTDAVLCTVPAVTGGRFDGEAERLAYQAPECCKGGTGDPRSDIFAVGALLWEAVCGRPRPVGASLDEARQMCERAAEPEFGGAGTGVSPTLIAITRRALAKDPGERYQSAREFLLALEAQMPAAANRDRGSLFAFMCNHFHEEHEVLQRLLESRANALLAAARAEAESCVQHGASALPEPPPHPGGSRLAHRLLRGALGLALAAGAVFAFFIVRPQHGSTRGPETIVQRLRPVGQPVPAELAGPPRSSGAGIDGASRPGASSPAPRPTVTAGTAPPSVAPPPSAPQRPSAMPRPAPEGTSPPAPPAAARDPRGSGGAPGAASDARPLGAAPQGASSAPQTPPPDFSLAPRTTPDDDESARGEPR